MVQAKPDRRAFLGTTAVKAGDHRRCRLAEFPDPRREVARLNRRADLVRKEIDRNSE